MIKLQHVTKRFEDYKALDDFSLTVPKGSVYGLMGLKRRGQNDDYQAPCGVSGAG